MAWKRVSKDPSRSEQVQEQYDTTTFATSQQALETWIVESDSVSTSPVEVLGASFGGTSLPISGHIYTLGGLAGFTCTQRIPKRTSASPFVWEVQIQYDRKIVPSPPEGTNNWNIDVSFTSEKVTQVTYRDKDGTAILNSAGQSYDPSLCRTYYDERIEVSFQTISPQDYRDAKGKVNSDSVTLNIKGISRAYTARQLLLEDAPLSASIPLSSGSGFAWTQKLVFLARKDTFVNHVLEQGFYQLKSGELVPCLDSITQQPVTCAVKLAADGSQLAPGDDPVFKDWKIESEVAFAGLFPT